MRWIRTEARDGRSEEHLLAHDDGRPTRYALRDGSPWGDGWCLIEALPEKGDERVLAIFQGRLDAAKISTLGVFHGGGERLLTQDELALANDLAITGCDIDNPEAVVAALVNAGVRPSSYAHCWEQLLHLARFRRTQMMGRRPS